MSDPNDLAAFLDAAWQHLGRGVADSRSPARYPTFATVSPQGRPEARTVVLRGASRAESTLEFHTDVETPKVAALRVTPFAHLHIWLPRADLQLRLSTRVEILTGNEVTPQWSKVPAASRVAYGTEPPPGTPIDHVHAYEKPAEQTRFAVLRCHLEEIDLVHLDKEAHRRARFMAQEDWRGTWLAP